MHQSLGTGKLQNNVKKENWDEYKGDGKKCNNAK